MTRFDITSGIKKHEDCLAAKMALLQNVLTIFKPPKSVKKICH